MASLQLCSKKFWWFYQRRDLSILILSDAGKVGINLGPAGGGGSSVLPTANFHTNGTLWFQNLANGTGSILVIDNNGNVFRSSASAKAANSTSIDLESLKDEIKQLREEINILKNIVRGGNEIEKKNTRLNRPQLYSNAPNPFNLSTLINYYIPPYVEKAVIILTDLKGIKLGEFRLSNTGKGVLKVEANKFPAGTYIYSLIADEKVVDSKKMIVTH